MSLRRLKAGGFLPKAVKGVYERMDYVIGIDGGGTSTTAILADKQGNILAQSKDVASNYHIVGKEQTAKVLSNLFHRLKKQLQLPNE